MEQKVITNSASQTKKIGRKLAVEILKNKQGQRPVIIGLDGDLGSGKTTFLQGFALGLGIKEKVLSPTFVIAKRFKIPQKTAYYKRQTASYANFHHIDCYRLNGPGDLKCFNFDDVVADKGNIVAIEWMGKISKAVPRRNISIKFKFICPEPSRRVEKNPDGAAVDDPRKNRDKREITLSGIYFNGTIKNNG